MREAWKMQVWEGTSWTKVRGAAGALRLEDGRMIHLKDTCPEDISKASMRHAKDVY